MRLVHQDMQQVQKKADSVKHIMKFWGGIKTQLSKGSVMEKENLHISDPQVQGSITDSKPIMLADYKKKVTFKSLTYEFHT